MGIYTTAVLRFGIVFPEDWEYQRYGEPEEDESYEEIEALCAETNLEYYRFGHYEPELGCVALVLKQPKVESWSGMEVYVRFNPFNLDVGQPTNHPEGIEIAEKLGGDWHEASWLLGWSQG